MGVLRVRACALAAAVVLAAGLGMLTPQSAFADYMADGCLVTTPKTSGRYTVNDLKGVRAFWLYFSGPDADNLHYIDGFDYRNVGPYRIPNDYDVHAGVRDQPSGWGVEGCASDNRVDHWTIVAPDGTKIITYVIGMKDPQVNRDGIVALLNGASWNGWDKDVTSYDLRSQYPNGAKLAFTSLPSGVTVKALNGSYNGVSTTTVNFVQPGPFGETVYSPDYTFLGATYDPASVIPSEPSAPAGLQHVYRMYDPRSGRHHITASMGERDGLVRGGWRYEGVAFDMPVSGQPVYRAYNPRTGDHMWTLSAREYGVITRNGWNAEGVAFHANDEGTVPVYRLYSGRSGDHLWTKSQQERDGLIRAGWRYEGVAWKVKA